MAAKGKYPNPEMLVEPSAVAKAEVAKTLIILDAREPKQYAAGHRSRAAWVDAAAWGKAFKDGKDAEGWSGRIGKLGINADAKVVVYDNNAFNEAARIWWILRLWGVKNVRLLNGNWATWKKNKLPIENDSEAAVPGTVCPQAAARAAGDQGPGVGLARRQQPANRGCPFRGRVLWHEQTQE